SRRVTVGVHKSLNRHPAHVGGRGVAAPRRAARRPGKGGGAHDHATATGHAGLSVEATLVRRTAPSRPTPWIPLPPTAPARTPAAGPGGGPGRTGRSAHSRRPPPAVGPPPIRSARDP